jgi:hypothetical protein
MAQTPTQSPKKQPQSTGQQIATQSNLKLVVDYMKCCDKCLSMVEIIQITTVLNDFVENGYSKSLTERFEKIDQIIFGKQPL